MWEKIFLYLNHAFMDSTLVSIASGLGYRIDFCFADSGIGPVFLERMPLVYEESKCSVIARHMFDTGDYLVPLIDQSRKTLFLLAMSMRLRI